MTKAQTTSTSSAAEKKAAAKAAKEANSEKFYRAKDDLFFCAQVIGMAACASAMSRSLRMIEDAGQMYPAELKKVKGISHGVNDWGEMPHECIDWALSLATNRMNEACDTMESAFMAAERGHAEG